MYHGRLKSNNCVIDDRWVCKIAGKEKARKKFHNCPANPLIIISHAILLPSAFMLTFPVELLTVADLV